MSVWIWTAGIVAIQLLGYGIGRIIEHRVRAFRNRGKIRLIQVDQDAKSCIMGLHRIVRGNEIDVPPDKRTNEPGQIVILEGDACLPRPQIATWVVHRRHGVNYVFPSDKESNESLVTEHGRKAYRVRENNPASYWYAASKNEMQDSIQANQDGEDWRVRLGPWMAMGIALCVIGIIAIAAMLSGKIGA